MVRKILKKDIRRRKSVNIILFLFITLASVFLSSSMNNILVVSSAVSYYMDYANVPDVNLLLDGTDEKAEIDHWLMEEAPGVLSYDYNTVLRLTEKNILIQREDGDVILDSGEANLFLGTMDSSYCKVFDQDGKTFRLNSGEIAMTQHMMDRNHLTPGDCLTIKTGDTVQKLVLKLAIKDAAYGNEMAGMNRMIISEADYMRLTEDESSDLVGLYYIDTREEAAFNRELNNQAFSTIMNAISRNTYTLAYSFDMIVAALLILIGVCLILIALLVLRFTLVFTIEEDYREIGIMKAMGLKNLAIRKLYLGKYAVLVTAGAVLGMGISIPVGSLMIAGVDQNMIMKDGGANLWINIGCTILIIVCVLAFCGNCTRRLNKISAISAIRGGQTGERYRRRAGMRLHNRRKMPVTVFLGMNDILSHVRRFLVLMVTFSVSFLLITIPLNTLNTMQGKKIVDRFLLDPESAVYLRNIEKEGEQSYHDKAELEAGLRRVELEMKEKGYDASLTALPIYFFCFEEPERDIKCRLVTIQVPGPNQDYLTYQEGKAPLLSNEIAFSQNVMNQNEWKVGDIVETVAGGERKELLITGTYSDYMQLGYSARLNPEIDCSEERVFEYWNIMVDLDTEKSQEELALELSQQFPDYEWNTAQEIVDRNVGGVQETLKKMLHPMTAMLCAVIMLITFLMERLFIVREKGEIAMMKSMGYKNRAIRLWQIIRMAGVALVSMVVAVPLSLASNRWVLKPIFGIMGADVEIQVVPWQVYGVYPGILLLGIIIAAAAATAVVKKVNIRELSVLE